MFGLGAPELIVILVVALLVFGPGRLPEIGSALGKGIRDFRKAFEGHDKEGGEKLEDQSDVADVANAANAANGASPASSPGERS